MSCAAAGSPWPAMWWAAGAAALIAVPFVAMLVPADEGRAGGGLQGSGMELPPRLLAFVLGYGLFGFGYVVTATFLVAIVRGSPARVSTTAAVSTTAVSGTKRASTFFGTGG